MVVARADMDVATQTVIILAYHEDGFAVGLDNSYTSGLDLGAQVGGRYYWNSSWAVNLEFGGGVEFSGGRVGVSKRF